MKIDKYTRAVIIFIIALMALISFAGQSFTKSNANSYIVDTATIMLTSPTVNSAPIYFLPKGKIVECQYNNNGFSMCSWKFSNSDEPIVGWTALKDLSKK